MLELIGVSVVALAIGFLVAWLMASKRSLARIGQLQGELLVTREQASQSLAQVQDRQSKIDQLTRDLGERERQLGQTTQQIRDQR